MTATVRSPDGRVVVDARLRERRVEVRRNEGRRRLQRLSAAAIVVLVLAAGYGVTRSPLLAVRALRLEGASHVTEAQIRRASGIHNGLAMTDVDASAAQGRLEALPWVATARVQREWPGEVRVTVTERTPVAQAAVGSAWFLIDDTGRVLDKAATRSAGLPTVEGVTAAVPGKTLAHADVLVPVVTRMPALVRDAVDHVSLVKGSVVQLTLVGGGVAVFGGADHLSAKYVSLTTMLDHLPQLHDGCTLDVSVPEAPTLTPEEGCA